jgi:hypothetical protein
MVLGITVGIFVGMTLGRTVGITVGIELGITVGISVGAVLGAQFSDTKAEHGQNRCDGGATIDVSQSSVKPDKLVGYWQYA